jgi:hypothetical protein
MFLAVFCYVIFWIVSTAYVFSVGHTRYDDDLPFGEMKWNWKTE